MKRSSFLLFSVVFALLFTIFLSPATAKQTKTDGFTGIQFEKEEGVASVLSSSDTMLTIVIEPQGSPDIEVSDVSHIGLSIRARNKRILLKPNLDHRFRHRESGFERGVLHENASFYRQPIGRF